LSTASACSSWPTGRMPYVFGASAPIATATTPSSASALLVSIRLICACGCGECKILPISMPGRERSSVYLPAPVVLPAASTMGMGRPMTEKSVMRCRHPLLLRFNRRFDGLIHLRIARAAAKIAAQGLPDLVVGRAWIRRDQVFDGHHEPRSAEAA